MPIYEYYCPDNHTVYQFYAKTLAQGRTVPRCPDNPAFKLVRRPSAFSVGTRKAEETLTRSDEGATVGDDARMEAALSQMEREFSHVDENDPKAMARLMRRMAELTGERIDGEAEEMVRKLEEGADPEALEASLGGDSTDDDGEGAEAGAPEEKPTPAERRARWKRFLPPKLDPTLYDYE